MVSENRTYLFKKWPLMLMETFIDENRANVMVSVGDPKPGGETQVFLEGAGSRAFFRGRAGIGEK